MNPPHDGDPITGNDIILMVATVLLSKVVDLAAKSLGVLWHRRPRTINGSGTLEARGTLTAHGEVIPAVTPSILRPDGGSASVRVTAGSAGRKAVGVGTARVTATAGGGHS